MLDRLRRHRVLIYSLGFGILALAIVGVTKVDYWWWVFYGQFRVANHIKVTQVDMARSAFPDTPLALDLGCVKIQLPFDLWWNVRPVRDFGFRAVSKELSLYSINVYAEQFNRQVAGSFYQELEFLLRVNHSDITIFDANEIAAAKIGRLLDRHRLFSGAVTRFTTPRSKGFIVTRDTDVTAYIFSQDEANGFALTFLNRGSAPSPGRFLTDVVTPILCGITYDNRADPLDPNAFRAAVERL